LIAERLERDAEKVVGAYFDALTAERTWFNNNGDAHSDVDYAMRLKAAEALLDRQLGKARQSVDVAHSGGLSIEALFVQDPLAETHTPLPEDQS
jgi:hypothetical protein